MSDAGVRSGQGDAYQAAIASKWAVRMLLDPAIEWIEVDTTALGADSKPIPVDDIVVHRGDGTTIYCQCKKNETNYVAWSARQLGDELVKAFRLLDADDDARVRFYSRSNFGQLAKLVEHAAIQPDEASYRVKISKELAAVDAELERLRADTAPDGRRTLRELLLRIRFTTTDEVEQINEELVATLGQHRATWPHATLERIGIRIYQLGARVVQPGPRPRGTHRLTREELLDFVGASEAMAPAEARASPRSAGLAALRFVADRLWPRLHRFFTVTLRALADPAERRAIAAHNDAQRARLAHELNVETYLPLDAKDAPDTPPRMQSRSTFYIPVQQVLRQIAGTSAGGDAASAQIAAQSRRSKPVRNLLRYLVHAREPIVVLGEPGAGKSVTLKQLALQIAFDDRNRVFPRLVVFVHLGRWKPSATGPDVGRLVRESAPPELRHLLDKLADERRLVVIFDGMDEMSRKTYTENVAALSEYATAQRGRVHTIFSCRIADFTPVFAHRRLVLLPFGRAQMRAYVARQIAPKGITIDGESLTAAGVVRRLMRHDVDMSVTNPFVLSLLVRYIAGQHTLPSSRTQLIDYYYTDSVARKLTAAAPPRDALFRDWGRLAYAIAATDEGSDLSVAGARRVLGDVADDVIEQGRVSGVLHRSLTDGTELLRFEHQRAQEFFAAHYVCVARVDVDWERFIDSPGWQETLVNVSQMDGGDTAVDALVESLAAIDSQETMRSIDSQARACARMETAARVVQSGSERERLKDLRERLASAARRLSTEGNPISQVKVLRVAQQIPAIDLRDVVAASCQSNVSWVRDQAMIVAASQADSPSASPFPQEILQASASGSIVTRSWNYLRAAWRLRSMALAGVVLLALGLFLFAAGAAAVVVPLAAYNGKSVIAAAVLAVADTVSGRTSILETVLHSGFLAYLDPWALAGIAGGTILVALAILLYSPALYWLAPAVGAALVWITGLMLFLLAIMDDASLGTLIKILVFVFLSTQVAAVLVLLLTAGAAAILTAARGSLLGTATVLWTRDIAYLRRSVAAHFRWSEIGKQLRDLLAILWIGVALLGMTVLVAIWNALSLPDLSLLVKQYLPLVHERKYFQFPFFLLVLFVAYALVSSIGGAVESWRTRCRQPLLAALKTASLAIASGVLVAGAMSLMFFIFETIFRWVEASTKSGWLSTLSASWLIVLIVALLLAAAAMAVIGAVLFGVYLLGKKFTVAIKTARQTPHELVRSLYDRDPDRQAAILSSLDVASTLHDARSLYDELVAIESCIRQEPAVTEYYRTLATLQERLRHSAPAERSPQAT